MSDRNLTHGMNLTSSEVPRLQALEMLDGITGSRAVLAEALLAFRILVRVFLALAASPPSMELPHARQ
jgi:hypothetical protein